MLLWSHLKSLKVVKNYFQKAKGPKQKDPYEGESQSTETNQDSYNG